MTLFECAGIHVKLISFVYGNMAAVSEEPPSECLCKDYGDHNTSNNGQHVYRHCHERCRVIHQDKLFLEHDVDTICLSERKIIQAKTADTLDINQKDDSWKVAALHNESIDKYSAERIHDNTDDDIEIVIYREKGSEDIRVNIVSKAFNAQENQEVLATSFEVQDNEIHSNQKENDVNKRTDNKNVVTKTDTKTMAKETKQVHFDGRRVQKQSPSLRSHRMEKESTQLVHKDNDKKWKHEEVNHRIEESKTKDVKIIDRYDRHHISNQEPRSSEYRQQRHSYISQSECDLRQNQERYRGWNNGKNNTNGKKITLLRRGSDNSAKLDYSNTKHNENFKKEKAKNCEVNAPNEIQRKQVDKDKNKYNIVKGSVSQSTTPHSGGDFKDARRIKSTIDADDKITNDKRDREKEKQRRKLKKKRQVRKKVPKTELEIFQGYIETGQLRSMFSRYKTEGLRYLKLKELMHNGTFSTKYKASFQNKQVVLTIYSDELANDINVLGMAHTGGSYFVLGFTDCMRGPYGSVLFMSMYHKFGNLHGILSRDTRRHVIGERHAQFITAGVLIAVDFLHQNEIVHGNIKPSKVLINALGYPVLTGFVKLLDNPDREDTQAYTPAYVAPEQLRGNRFEPIDIFSVGCMAYEIIAGKTPFDGETREQTLTNIQKAERPVYDAELFSYAGELFIDSCLRRNPRERFSIGKERCNLVFEEWFSTLNWRDFRRQTLRSPILDALQNIEKHATLSLEEKTLSFQWGQVMDTMCPYTATLDYGDDISLCL